MEKIPIVICIDVEPDIRAIDPNVTNDWVGFEKTFEFYEELRPRLEDATSSAVRFSWFVRMDAQIEHTYGTPNWAATRYRHLFDRIEKHEDEIGLHAHAWRWNEASDGWVADMEDQEWVEHCVRLSFAAFEKSFHRRCLSFRFGDHWINDATLNLIEKLGACFDLTVEPGPKRPFFLDECIGSLPDCSDVPQRPYHPSRENFTRPDSEGGRRLWILPLSTGQVDWALTSLIHGRYPESSIRGKLRARLRNPGSTYEGFLDRVDCQMISGWAFDAKRPDLPINVEIFDGEVLLKTVPANVFRPDLLDAAKGNGRHSFAIPIPASLNDGNAHSLRAKVEGTGFELRRSRQTERVEPLLLLNTKPWLMKREMVSLLSVERPYLALPVRSDVSLHSNEVLNMKENFDQIVGHPLAKRFSFVTPAELVEQLK